MQTGRINRVMLLFFVMIAAAALGNGLSDGVYSNYFKDAFQVTAQQRALIEIPRELPGLLCALVIAALSGLGDLKISLIAQVLACLGLTAMGLLSPTFGVMLLLLFINSLGMHTFMPLQDSIGMSLAEPGQMGRRVGQYASVKVLCSFVAGLTVFFGFRLGWFSFTTPVILLFLIGAGAFVVAIVAALLLVRTEGTRPRARQRVRLVLRRQYRWYYLMAMLHGIQKQIAYVFAAWVLVDLLLKGADVMSLLMISASFVSIFFMRAIGRWIDRVGIARMLRLNAWGFVLIYLAYGFVVWGITSSLLPKAGLSVMIIYVLFVLDRLNMQMHVLKAVYLRQIALDPGEVTHVLSTGISLDHVVSILAAQLSGLVWALLGPEWVFFMAAFFSLGNLYAARWADKGLKAAAAEGAAT
ncbi:MAG: MFS transporter [Clostridiales bacterium]|nr:MFS transporter [Clostridiales bacterium]